MKTKFAYACVLVCLAFDLAAQDFTSVQTGAWEDCNTWGTCPGTVAGTNYPERTNSVSIGHIITINATDDNGSTGTAPNAIGTSNVCGVGCGGTCNTPTGCNAVSFYHTGDITVTSGGELEVTGVASMFGGTITAESGSIIDIQGDVFILGLIDGQVGSDVNFGDDVAVSGYGNLNLDSDGDVVDDLYIDGEDSGFCGDGSLTVGGDIRVWNSLDGSTLDQVCETSTVTCSDGDCCEEGGCTTDVANTADDGTTGGNGAITPTEGTGDVSDILPIELIFFTAQQDGGLISFRWATASETNNDFFTIQGSGDALEWHHIGTFDGAGNSSSVLNYQYNLAVDDHIIYFRLKQTDFDGQYSYSDIVSAAGNQRINNQLIIYPNPASEQVTIMDGDGRIISTIQILSINGRVVKYFDQLNAKGSSKLALDGLEDGIYLIKSSFSNGDHRTSRLVIRP